MDEGYCDDDVVFPAICMERRTFFAQGLVEKEQKKGGPSSWKGIATWLILPVVICLSQRLSHACVSINSFVL